MDKDKALSWFSELRDRIGSAFEDIEKEAGSSASMEYIEWTRAQGGGGKRGYMCGSVFEKAGVNVSAVYGKAPKALHSVLGQDTFWASGISLICHMQSPYVPAVHMNTRFIQGKTTWMGGGIDLTPYVPLPKSTIETFEKGLQTICEKFRKGSYTTFKKACDDYFYLPHRQEPRGIGGIFFDNETSGDWDKDFSFVQAVGNYFLSFYPKLVRQLMSIAWTEEERRAQLIKRGRYVEFNLLYDRGTDFGLKSDGNVEAILVSMPPKVLWP